MIYSRITIDEEIKIRREAAYSGIKGGAEIVLRDLQKQREQSGFKPSQTPSQFKHWRE